MIGPWLLFSLSISFLALYLNIWFMLSMFDRKANFFEKVPVASVLPVVSILIPARNEGSAIAKTIRSVRSLDYPRDKLEIIALPNACTDDTAEQATANGVRVISLRKAGKANALNAGIRRARGELIGIVDADTTVSRSSLRKMVGYFNDPEVGAVTTFTRVSNPRGFFGRMQSIEYVFSGMLKKVFSMVNSLYITTGTLSVVRRDAARKIGFSDETHTEDMDFAVSMIKNDYKIVNCLDAHAYTSVPLKFRALTRQRVRWYRGFISNARKHSDVLFTRKHFDLGSFVIPVGIVSAAAAIILTGNLAVQALTNVLVSVKSLFFVPLMDQIDIAVMTASMDPKFAMFNPYVSMMMLAVAASSLILAVASMKKLDRLKPKHAVLLPLYILVYYFFNVVWWLAAAAKEAAGSRRKW